MSDAKQMYHAIDLGDGVAHLQRAEPTMATADPLNSAERAILTLLAERDQLRARVAELEAENERLKESILGRLSRHVVVNWAAKIAAEMMRLAGEAEKRSDEAESPYWAREHFGRASGLREAAVLLESNAAPVEKTEAALLKEKR